MGYKNEQINYERNEGQRIWWATTRDSLIMYNNGYDRITKGKKSEEALWLLPCKNSRLWWRIANDHGGY